MQKVGVPLLVCLVAIAAGPGRAQDVTSPAPGPTIRVTTTEVALDLAVRDKPCESVSICGSALVPPASPLRKEIELSYAEGWCSAPCIPRCDCRWPRPGAGRNFPRAWTDDPGHHNRGGARPRRARQEGPPGEKPQAWRC